MFTDSVKHLGIKDPFQSFAGFKRVWMEYELLGKGKPIFKTVPSVTVLVSFSVWERVHVPICNFSLENNK